MRNLIIILFLFTVLPNLRTQNLVINPSFEFFSKCPTNNSGINLAPPWKTTDSSGTTPDYFNKCFIGVPSKCDYVDVPLNFGGYCLPRTGNAYAGLLAYYPNGGINNREYIQQRFSSRLVAGQLYNIEFWVQLADYSNFSTHLIGAHISIGPISQPNFNQPIDISPTIESNLQLSDTSDWIKVSGEYVASGGENYITIGNFNNFVITSPQQSGGPGGGNCPLTGGAYYYLDDISIEAKEFNQGNHAILFQEKKIL